MNTNPTTAPHRPYNWQADPAEYDREWKSSEMVAAIVAHRYPTNKGNR